MLKKRVYFSAAEFHFAAKRASREAREQRSVGAIAVDAEAQFEV